MQIATLKDPLSEAQKTIFRLVSQDNHKRKLSSLSISKPAQLGPKYVRINPSSVSSTSPIIISGLCCCLAQVSVLRSCSLCLQLSDEMGAGEFDVIGLRADNFFDDAIQLVNSNEILNHSIFNTLYVLQVLCAHENMIMRFIKPVRDLSSTCRGPPLQDPAGLCTSEVARGGHFPVARAQ